MSFDKLAWHNAAYLHERSPSPTKGDPKRWSDAFGPDETLASTVHTLGLTLDDFCARLGPQDRPAQIPTWVQAIDRRAALGEETGDEPYLVLGDEIGLMRPVLSLVRGSQRELHARVARITEGSRLTVLLPDLLARAWPSEEIGRAIGRTMVLELNVARVEGRLYGNTPSERYADYIRLLGDPSTQEDLWAEYPVLLRHVGDLLTGWVDSRAEFAERLLADLGQLDTWFDGGLGDITEARFGAGDTHRRGRSVAVVAFTGGKVVYKPRPLAADLAWDAVLDWYHKQDPAHDLIAPRTLACQGYGWSGFVEPLPCHTPDDLRDFFWRTGALLALNYALCGVDVHHENLIAHGAYPVVIDMEALFHGALPTPAARSWGTPADDLMSDSVLNVGLLPTKLVVRNQGNAHALETSPVGVERQQKSLIPVPVAEQAGTDEMRFVEQYVAMPEDTASRPHMGGEPADPRDCAVDLEAGFAWTYRTIAADRASWGVLLHQFADVELRHIPRATAYYTSLLEDSRHPDFLRDARDRDRLLTRLALGANGSQPWEQLVPYELRDLRRGDIPFFASTPSSRDLVDSEGVRIPDCLEQAPLDEASRRLSRFDEVDLATQTMLIRRAFESLHPATAAHQGVAKLPLPDRPPTRKEVLEEAVQLAHGLCDAAIRREDRVGWIGLNFIDESIWQVGPMAADLYAGMPGIGLFLSTASALSGDARLREYAELTAESVAQQARAAADQLANTPPSLLREALQQHADAGAFGVTGSLIYYLAHAAVRHRRSEFLDVAERSLDTLDQHIALDARYDVIGGSAGAILAALALHTVRPTSAALRVAGRAAERLLQEVEPIGDGVAWRTSLGPQPLTGMSHGAGGIAYALARLHAVTPRPEYAEAVAGALRYERSALDPVRGNWPDLRSADNGGSGGHQLAWCHGAPGVGMSRLGILRTAAPCSAMAEDDLRTAENTTHAFLFGADGGPLVSMGNNGLCHGDLGNLEFLLLAAQWRGDAAGMSTVRRAVGALLESGRRGWLTGQLSPESLPGLMYGRAGIGYNLLRLTFPEQVPSVLLLESP
ncbi:type 2 lanthipeptide synthetase LanM family protein [Streptomyces sp. NPDC005209]|uniref:type 2 lanthipeptide synthetase LanM family protein n=1 Tax=Streptomyces sp. NPDC005209 TaxID=3156715 RepID=UPI0033ABF784